MRANMWSPLVVIICLVFLVQSHKIKKSKYIKRHKITENLGSLNIQVNTVKHPPSAHRLSRDDHQASNKLRAMVNSMLRQPIYNPYQRSFMGPYDTSIPDISFENDLFFKNVSVSGIRRSRLQNIKMQLAPTRIDIKLKIPKLIIEGDFELLVTWDDVPLQCHGHFKISLLNVILSAVIGPKTEDTDTGGVFHLETAAVTVTIKKIDLVMEVNKYAQGLKTILKQLVKNAEDLIVDNDILGIIINEINQDLKIYPAERIINYLLGRLPPRPEFTSESNAPLKLGVTLKPMVNSSSEVTSEVEDSSELEDALEPNVSEEPKDTSKSKDSLELEGTSEPKVSLEQEGTSEPKFTLQPESTYEPKVSLEQKVTSEPKVNLEQVDAPEPKVHLEAEGISEPKLSLDQEVTSEPKVNLEPEGTSEPKVTLEKEGILEPKVNLEQKGTSDPKVSLEQEHAPEPKVISKRENVRLESEDVSGPNVSLEPDASESKVSLEQEGTLKLKLNLERDASEASFRLESEDVSEPDFTFELEDVSEPNVSLDPEGTLEL